MTPKLQQRLELWQSRIDATDLAEDYPAAVADKVRRK